MSIVRARGISRNAGPVDGIHVGHTDLPTNRLFAAPSAKLTANTRGGAYCADMHGGNNCVSQGVGYWGTTGVCAPTTTHPMANDWWAFGTLIYEMVFGKAPYSARSFDNLMKKITQDELSFPAGHSFSADGVDIVTRLLEKTEADRLGAEDSPEVQRHPWFAGVDFDAMLRKEIPPVFVPEQHDDPLVAAAAGIRLGINTLKL